MEGQVRQSLINLEEELLENASEFDFFQAYRILARIQGDTDSTSIKVRPSLSLGYAVSDVEDILKDEDTSSYELVTNLAGLYGVSSPLPDFITENLLDNEWEELNGPREFLDLIQSHLLSKLYSAWKLHRIAHNTIEAHDMAYWRLLGSLLGNPEMKVNPESPFSKSKMQLGGLFSLYNRSAASLKIMLKELLCIDSVAIKEYQSRTAVIPDKSRIQLGESNTTLGEDLHIGSVVEDRCGAVEVCIGPISEHEYRDKLKPQERIDLISKMVRDLVAQPLSIMMKIIVTPDSSGMVLGQKWNSLGDNSYLSNPNLKAEDLNINIQLM